MAFKNELRGHWDIKKHGADMLIRWTCCAKCKREHKSLFIAKLHYYWLRIIGRQ